MGDKYKDVKLIYTCVAACPPDIFMDRIYTLQESGNEFILSDGNYVKKFKHDELWYIKMLFSPKGTSWEELDKVEVVKHTEKPTFMK